MNPDLLVNTSIGSLVLEPRVKVLPDDRYQPIDHVQLLGHLGDNLLSHIEDLRGIGGHLYRSDLKIKRRM